MRYLLLALAIAVTAPALAQSVRMKKSCINEEVCEIVVEDLTELMRQHEAALNFVDLLKARIRELESQGARCAKLDVTEPSKNAPKKAKPEGQS